MRIGQLDQRIELEHIVQAPDGGGGYVESWVSYAHVWANVRPMSGRERFQAQQTQAAADYRFTIRYRDDVTEADRIRWRGKTYNIRFIADAGPREPYLAIDAELERG